MARETLADKLAKKTFLSDEIQKSWAVHMQAFGPILEPAFAQDYQSRVHLTAALNLISNRKIENGLKKLQALQDKCETDADKAALLFFMGLCFEMAGRRQEMMAYYNYANEYEHRFYLPYLKLAKIYLAGRQLGLARENFRAAVGCFAKDGLDPQQQLIAGSAYANLATCLTSMHRYDEAEAALEQSHRLCPALPGRAATEAILYAVRADEELLAAALAELQQQAPQQYEAVRQGTERILARTDPMFFPVPVAEEQLDAFWAWFVEYKPTLLARLDRKEFEEAVTPVSEKMPELFPFLEEPLYIALGQDEDGSYVLELHDMYAAAVMDLLERLMEAKPQSANDPGVRFVVVHE